MLIHAPQDFKYDIYIIGANGPSGSTPQPADPGSWGAKGRDASCNWASVCVDSCVNGGSGGVGVTGKNGTPQATDPPINGADVQPATITIGQLTGADLWIFSAGGNGGTAGNGGAGGAGGTGGTGGSSASCPSGHCSGCNGGTGGTGGVGGNGGVSGSGGSGATINVTFSSASFGVYTSTPASSGGLTPSAGSGGVGGPGGYPGGNAGPGATGGNPGSAGNPGIPSTINVTKQ